MASVSWFGALLKSITSSFDIEGSFLPASVNSRSQMLLQHVQASCHFVLAAANFNFNLKRSFLQIIRFYSRDKERCFVV